MGERQKGGGVVEERKGKIGGAVRGNKRNKIKLQNA